MTRRATPPYETIPVAARTGHRFVRLPTASPKRRARRQHLPQARASTSWTQGPGWLGQARKPSDWIPAFAGMATSVLNRSSVGRAAFRRLVGRRHRVGNELGGYRPAKLLAFIAASTLLPPAAADKSGMSRWKSGSRRGFLAKVSGARSAAAISMPSSSASSRTSACSGVSRPRAALPPGNSHEPGKRTALAGAWRPGSLPSPSSSCAQAATRSASGRAPLSTLARQDR